MKGLGWIVSKKEVSMAKISGWWHLGIGLFILTVSLIIGDGLLAFAFVGGGMVLWGMGKLFIARMKNPKNDIGKAPSKHHAYDHSHNQMHNRRPGHINPNHTPHHQHINTDNQNRQQHAQDQHNYHNQQYNQQQAHQPKIFFCRGCGNRLRLHDNFCSHCGMKIK